MNTASSPANVRVAPGNPVDFLSADEAQKLATWAACIFYRRKPCTSVTAKTLHFFAAAQSLTMPNGELYQSTAKNLKRMRKALDYARLLHLIPPNAILEPDPYIYYCPTHFSTGVHLQHVEIWAEQTTGGYLLTQTARDLKVPLVTSPEQFSFTMLWNFARRAAYAKTKIAIFYLTDMAKGEPGRIKVRASRVLRAFNIKTEIRFITPRAQTNGLEAWHSTDPSAPTAWLEKNVSLLLTAA